MEVKLQKQVLFAERNNDAIAFQSSMEREVRTMLLFAFHFAPADAKRLRLDVLPQRR
jgi:hypothetical protein